MVNMIKYDNRMYKFPTHPEISTYQYISGIQISQVSTPVIPNTDFALRIQRLVG